MRVDFELCKIVVLLDFTEPDIFSTNGVGTISLFDVAPWFIPASVDCPIIYTLETSSDGTTFTPYAGSDVIITGSSIDVDTTNPF